MKFKVDDSILEIFPNITIGILKGEISSKKDDYEEKLEKLKADSVELLKNNFIDQESLLSHPNITSWRETYNAFGTKPKKYPPTHESLAKRVYKSGSLPTIFPAVDVYLTNQLVHLLPHGGYDYERLSGDLFLTRATEGEVFEPLGGGQELTESGEVIYKDNERILTRRWNYRDSEYTKITEETSSFILMIETTRPEFIDEIHMETILVDLKNRYEYIFNGIFKVDILKVSSDRKEFEV